MVVAAVDRCAAPQIRAAEQAKQRLLGGPCRVGRLHCAAGADTGRAWSRSVPRWGAVDEQIQREVTHLLVPVANDESWICTDHAHHVGVQIPALEYRLQRRDIVRLGHDQHAFLRLAEHHLIWGHPCLAARRARHVDLDAAATPMRELRAAAAQSGRTEVLHGDHPRIACQLEARLHQALLEKRVAHLHRRAARGAGRVEHDRREARTMDAVTARVGADQQHEVAGSPCRGEHHPALLDDADAHRVDKAVGSIRLVEIQLAAHGGHADAVAVASDPRHHAVEEVALVGLLERTEAERVEQRDRPRTHREDVAQDAADTGRRTLVGLDGAGMIV